MGARVGDLSAWGHAHIGGLARVGPSLAVEPCLHHHRRCILHAREGDGDLSAGYLGRTLLLFELQLIKLVLEVVDSLLGFFHRGIARCFRGLALLKVSELHRRSLDFLLLLQPLPHILKFLVVVHFLENGQNRGEHERLETESREKKKNAIEQGLSGQTDGNVTIDFLS